MRACVRVSAISVYFGQPLGNQACVCVCECARARVCVFLSVCARACVRVFV